MWDRSTQRRFLYVCTSDVSLLIHLYSCFKCSCTRRHGNAIHNFIIYLNYYQNLKRLALLCVKLMWFCLPFSFPRFYNRRKNIYFKSCFSSRQWSIAWLIIYLHSRNDCPHNRNKYYYFILKLVDKDMKPEKYE